MLKNIIDIFWKATSETTHFKLFSSQHLIALGIIIGIIVFMFINKEKLKNPYIRNKVGKIIGITLFIQQFSMISWYITSGNFTIKESLPLYMCRLVCIASIFMVTEGSYAIFEVVYFWGIQGAVQALLTPDTGGFMFPHVMFLQFFVGHGSMLFAVFFMILAYGYRPTFKSLKKAINCLLIYVVTVGGFNYLVDGNYSYLRAKPQTASVLDYFPPYPYYIPIILMGFIAIFGLLYVPYYIKDIKEKNNFDINENLIENTEGI